MKKMMIAFFVILAVVVAVGFYSIATIKGTETYLESVDAFIEEVGR